MNKTDALANRLHRMWPFLNERARRVMAASEAVEFGRGGIVAVHKACGLSRVTISKGIKEFQDEVDIGERIRKPGGGRHSLINKEVNMISALQNLLEESTRGDPETALRWTCKSTRQLAQELTKTVASISHTTVSQLLASLGYSLQGNKKTLEGASHPDRDAQFKYINQRTCEIIASGNPVISVDTKKKEILGNYDNKGTQWHPKKTPREVNGHDFPDKSLDRAYPYGIYDIAENKGFVNIGTDHDTGTFAVASIRGWWKREGCTLYPHAKELMITADGGGSNGCRLRLWKFELSKLATELGLTIHVSHFPPGTSKWNKIEHRLFSFISSNWRGEPLQDYDTIVNLISNTKTAEGLSVKCRLDRRKYPLGRKVTKDEFATIQLEKSEFHGEWNYSIHKNQ